jgi:hypothetical protein
VFLVVGGVLSGERRWSEKKAGGDDSDGGDHHQLTSLLCEAGSSTLASVATP